MRGRVCVVGSCNTDLTFRVPRLPRPGETVSGPTLLRGQGGKGANQAVMAARMGAAVSLVGCVGADPFGDAALAEYARQGIDTTFVTRDPDRPTGLAAIVVEDSGQNQITVASGANAGLTPQAVRAAANRLSQAAIVVAQFEVPLDSVLEAFRIARSVGVLTLLNPAPLRALPPEILPLTDLCIPNETELGQILGTEPTSLEEGADQVRRRLSPRGVVIVTCGDRGAFLCQAGSKSWLPAQRVAVVDTSGAGDAFIGALAAGLAGGRELLLAGHLANAAAALSVTRPGTQPSYPTAEEVAAFQNLPG